MNIRLRFAWLPTQMTSGQRIWLTHYWHHQYLYDETTGRPPLWGRHFEFTETKAEQTFRVLKESVLHNRNVWNEYELTKKDKNA